MGDDRKIVKQSVATFAVTMAFVLGALALSALLSQAWYGDWRCTFINYSHCHIGGRSP